MTTRADRMFAEVDRQLELVRAQADGMAARSGFLLSATTAAFAILIAQIAHLKHGLTLCLVALGLALVFGVLVQIPRLNRGPLAITLTTWGSTSVPADRAVTELYTAKLTCLDGNIGRIQTMTTLFYLQAVAVVVSVVLALVFAGQG